MRVRFKIDYDKCVQGMHYLACLKPGITQYYVGKVFFFADREHLLDWGRPISGDRYVAMEHGPVPSVIYNLVKSDAGIPDAVADLVAERITARENGNKKELFSKVDNPSFPALSGSDKDYLKESLEKHGNMTFRRLRELSHQDKAYESAWSLAGLNNEMNPVHWLRELGDPEVIYQQLAEKSVVDISVH